MASGLKAERTRDNAAGRFGTIGREPGEVAGPRLDRDPLLALEPDGQLVPPVPGHTAGRVAQEVSLAEFVQDGYERLLEVFRGLQLQQPSTCLSRHVLEERLASTAAHRGRVDHGVRPSRRVEDVLTLSL